MDHGGVRAWVGAWARLRVIGHARTVGIHTRMTPRCVYSGSAHLFSPAAAAAAAAASFCQSLQPACLDHRHDDGALTFDDTLSPSCSMTRDVFFFQKICVHLMMRTLCVKEQVVEVLFDAFSRRMILDVSEEVVVVDLIRWERWLPCP